ncbi:MAG: RNA polymerase sigma factor [Prevotella sp.]|jgi:RNA polymerase sigma-70 factor (ECF subfamily)|nr:RNA polymerase sigma factor [Prevotella sp.]
MENLQQLIAGCKEKDREAQKKLYEEYARTMYGVCLRYAPNQQTAEDLLHDGFIKIFSAINAYSGRGSFEGWMKRIFVNLALERIRKEKNDPVSNEISEIPDLSDEDANHARQISEAELMKMIQELPKGYQAVFNMYAIENLSHREIAQILGIAEGTSRSQYIRARQLLQEKVLKYYKKNSN